MNQYIRDNWWGYVALVAGFLTIWAVLTVSRRLEQRATPELQSIRQQQLQIVCAGSKFDSKRTDSRCN